MTNILLIDDDVLEKEILTRTIKKIVGKQPFEVHHAFKCSTAIDQLLTHKFDIILLDNLLAASISGKFSVPILKQYIGICPLVMISDNIDIDYLEDPTTLGVDAIIEKSDLPLFLLKFFSAREVLLEKGQSGPVLTENAA